MCDCVVWICDCQEVMRWENNGKKERKIETEGGVTDPNGRVGHGRMLTREAHLYQVSHPVQMCPTHLYQRPIPV